jgi:hypothetical protein
MKMQMPLLAAAALVLSVGPLGAQAPAAATPSAAAAKAAFEIWQVDLVPTGSGFAVTKPVLEGDNWVFQVWPERDTVRIPKSKIKKITPRSKQLASETAYRLDLAPSGEIFARDTPVLKGTTYTFHRWRDGNLMSLRAADVKKVTKLTPAEIFQTHLQYFGPKQIGNLAMEGGTATIIPAPGASNEASAGAYTGADHTYSNWIYEGTPGVDDAWAPPSATIAYPGDVPKAPE